MPSVSLCESPSLPFYDSLQGRDQGRQVVLNDVPENTEVHLVVSVDQAVPQADHLAPGHLRVSGPGFLRDKVGSLADDLQQAGERQFQSAVHPKISAPRSFREGERFLRLFQHLSQADAILMSRHK